MAKAHRLGVLFVHGMGGQRRGAPLTQFGEPLVEWLTARDGQVGSPSGVTLRDVCVEDGEPASAVVEFDREGVRRSWLLAESWWAEVFDAPAYQRLGGWLTLLAPWMAAEYARTVYARHLARNDGSPRLAKPLGWLLLVVAVLAGPIAAGLAVVLLLVLGIVNRLPVDKVHAWTDRVVRALTGSLGDVFVLVTQPLAAAAVRTRVLRDLAWLEKRCDRVVVVAHSAGSAVTYEALRPPYRTQPVALYVTLGEAIWRMRWVRRLVVDGRTFVLRWLGAASALVPVAVVGLVARSRGEGWATAHPSWVWPTVLLAGVAASLFTTSAVWAAVDSGTGRDAVIAEGGVIAPRWVDFAASSDPVPEGTLDDALPRTERGVARVIVALSLVAILAWGWASGDPLRWLSKYQGLIYGVGFAVFSSTWVGSALVGDESASTRTVVAADYVGRTTRNRRSLLGDHTTYPANVEGFVTPLARELAVVDGTTFAVPNADAAAERRRERTAGLASGRFVVGMAGAWLLLSLAAPLAGRGSRAVVASGLVWRWLHWVPTGTTAGVVTGEAFTGPWVGLGAAAAAVVAARLLLGKAWTSWDRAEAVRCLRGDAMTKPSPGSRWTYDAARPALAGGLGALSFVGTAGWWRVGAVAVTAAAVGLALVPGKRYARRDRDRTTP